MAAVARASEAQSRLRETAELLAQRGYAVGPDRLAEVCLGGPAAYAELRAAMASCELVVDDGLLVVPGHPGMAQRSRSRADRHPREATRYLAEAEVFARLASRLLPFVRGIAVAGSLAAGGFVETDDVDLNLLVDDGHRHLAYLCVNALGYAHALGWRRKPVDASSRRPIAPRLMTVNLVLEPRQWQPLARVDGQMALELLLCRPLTGRVWWAGLVSANPRLLERFPQLAGWASRPLPPDPRPLLPAWLFPSWLDAPARIAGSLAWRWLQWTRRRSPEALARVAFVRSTMRPYTLFDAS